MKAKKNQLCKFSGTEKAISPHTPINEKNAGKCFDRPQTHFPKYIMISNLNKNQELNDSL